MKRHSTAAAAIAAASLLALTACSQGSHDNKTATPTKTHTATPTTTPTPTPAENAEAIAQRIADKVGATNGITPITEANDVNKSLGRPGGYTSAAVINDPTAECENGPGVACGATVEQYASEKDAQARKDYIDKLMPAMPTQMREWDTVDGVNVLRVTAKVSPARADAFKTEFLKK